MTDAERLAAIKCTLIRTMRKAAKSFARKQSTGKAELTANVFMRARTSELVRTQSHCSINTSPRRDRWT